MLGVGTVPLASLRASFLLAVGPGAPCGAPFSHADPVTPRRTRTWTGSSLKPRSRLAACLQGGREILRRAFPGNQPACSQCDITFPCLFLIFESQWTSELFYTGFRCTAGRSDTSVT